MSFWTAREMELGKGAPVPHIRQRYEAFWRGEAVEGPLLKVTAPNPSAPPPRPGDSQPPSTDDLFDWFTNPERVIPRLQHGIAHTHYAGDAFPLVFPVATRIVAIQAAYHGGKHSLASGTGWCDPAVHDWARRRPLAVDTENRWWRLSRRLLEEGTTAMAGRAAVGIPDLQGGGQILALLRGSEEFAVDLVEHPD